jgi:protein SCO1/2
MKRLAAFVLALATVTAAHAGLAPAELKEVTAASGPGARFPLWVTFTRLDGQTSTLGDALDGSPAVIVFADFTCSNLCGPALTFAANGLSKTGLAPGKDFRLIVIGLDPKDTAAQARDLIARQVGPDTAVAAATIVLRGTQHAVDAETAAGGYHYVYDKADDQFAHPAAAYVVASDGRIVRVLSALGLGGADLRLALVDAGQGRIGTLTDQVRLHCFGFDPVRGIYTVAVTRVLTAAAAVTILAVSGAIVLMLLATRRRAAS